MGVIVVIVYVAVIWLALAIMMIGLLNLAKWRVRAAARAADAEPPRATTTHQTLPLPTPDRTSHGTLRPEMASRAASAWPKPTG